MEIGLLSVKGQLLILLVITLVAIVYFMFFKKPEAKLTAAVAQGLSFIESPNIVVVRIRMEQDDLNFVDEPAATRAEMIWKYKDMKSSLTGAAEEPKKAFSESFVDGVVAAVMSAVTPEDEGDDFVNVEEEDVEVSDILLEEKENSEKLKSGDPGSNHRLIEDEDGAFEEVENLDEILDRE